MANQVTRPNAGTWGAGNAMVPLYWDSVFAENLYPSLFFYQFGAKRRVPPNFGISIKITRMKKQTGKVTSLVSTSYGQPVAATAISGLCAQTVSGTLQKYRGVYGNSDIALLTSLGDPTEFAIRDISRDLALQMDTAVRNTLSGISNGTWMGGSGVTTFGSVKSTSVLKVADIIRAVARLRSSNNPRWPDGNYPLVVHPLVTYDIKQTLSTGHAGAWSDIHKYDAGTAENLYRGEVGRIYGARIVESTNIKRITATLAGGTMSLTTGVSSGNSGWTNYMFAPEAYYVVEMDQMTGRVIVKGLGSAGALDADNSLSTVAAKVFFTAFRGFQNSPNASVSTAGYETRMIRLATGSTLV